MKDLKLDKIHLGVDRPSSEECLYIGTRLGDGFGVWLSYEDARDIYNYLHKFLYDYYFNKKK